jgi:hypothetical protein
MRASVAVFEGCHGAASTVVSIERDGGRALAVRVTCVQAQNAGAQLRERSRPSGGSTSSASMRIIVRKNVVDLSEEEWDAVVDVTLKSVYLFRTKCSLDLPPAFVHVKIRQTSAAPSPV